MDRTKKRCCQISYIPQQRKLMGSSAQISSGVCRRGSQEQVPEEGSGRFRRVPECAGVGSGGGFRKVPESSGVKWCRFRREVPEDFGGSGVCWRRFRRLVPEALGRFRRVLESSGACWCRFRRQSSEGSGGFRRVPARVGVGSGDRVRKVPESSGVVCCLATLTGAAMGLFRSRG